MTKSISKNENILASCKHKTQKLLLEIEFTRLALFEHIESTMLEFNLTNQQFNFLRILRGTYPEAQCMQEIRSKLVDRNADTTRLALRLIKKSWIVQVQNPLDKRKREFKITESGLELLTKIDKKFPNYPYCLFKNMDENTLNFLIEHLGQIRRDIEIAPL